MQIVKLGRLYMYLTACTHVGPTSTKWAPQAAGPLEMSKLIIQNPMLAYIHMPNKCIKKTPDNAAEMFAMPCGSGKDT